MLKKPNAQFNLIFMLAEELISKLQILPLEDLKIHEQTIPQNLRSLRETMLNLGRLVDPLIIDKEHKIVLDGNHRRQVLELLKTENAICQPVDYMDPSIRIGGWHLAAKNINFDSISAEKVDKSQGFHSLQKMQSSFMAISKKGKCEECKLIPSSSQNLHAIAKEQEQFLSCSMGGGFSLENNGNGSQIIFIEDNRMGYFLENGYTVLARRIFSKEEVIKEAVAGRPLPPKSTRHMIPNRIIRLNFRLGYLNEPIETSSLLLQEMIKKRVKHGSARYYTEPVIVLY